MFKFWGKDSKVCQDTDTDSMVGSYRVMRTTDSGIEIAVPEDALECEKVKAQHELVMFAEYAHDIQDPVVTSRVEDGYIVFSFPMDEAHLRYLA